MSATRRRRQRGRLRLDLTPRRVGRGLLVALLVGCVAELASETLTLTSYYPSPSGIYRRLTSTMDAILARDGGRVGIGTATPAEKLEVQGRVKIVDGNQADGKVLTSDANGVATWKPSSSGRYSVSCINGVPGWAQESCCRLNNIDGEILCKQALNWSQTGWRDVPSPFAAGTADYYQMTLSIGTPGGAVTYICRTRSSTGATECKRATDWALSGWTSTTDPF